MPRSCQVQRCAAFSGAAGLPASSALRAVGSLSVEMHSQREGTAVSTLCISMTTLLNKPRGEPRALDTARLCQESGPWPRMEPGGPGTAPSNKLQDVTDMKYNNSINFTA